ncbi:TIGR01440 family protein [Veillonella caviae]|uniref:TIGR01440 family protein n=2 Tax=Veillonella caviae TaxID=248316 RepID=UPI000F8EDF57|nr:TIGR01440 family protein [Veillonella caviae]MDY5716094.1 TIGR01440 family protein [Veillonella caviae]MDY5787085.1 TIGR01440 family protein [Veillonella caviae]
MHTIDGIRESTRVAMSELLAVAKMEPGQFFVVGCSTSEVRGNKIGTDSHIDVAEVVFDEIYKAVHEYGIQLAVQCCEHLNRALIVERSAITWEEEVNVVPQLHAGGAMAMTAYARFNNPAAVEYIEAHGGIDIGDTFIGMHMKHVAVPVRMSIKEIGNAHVTACRVRPKSIGGSRAVYNESLL